MLLLYWQYILYMQFAKLPKLKPGDKVAIVSPSFAAPGKWPHVYELALSRVRDVFGLEPVEFPATSKIGASAEARAKDLIEAYTRPDIKAVIASLGGDDQVTYIKNLPAGPFISNPKPFFGFSDNSHFQNFLWLNGIPSFYGASLFTQFGMQKRMDEFTVKYLRHALFDEGSFELTASPLCNDMGLNWDDPENLNKERVYEPNEGWFWDGEKNAEGISWGGCLESIDEMLRHGIAIPTLEQFDNLVLIAETSEEIPSHDYVRRVYRALGERGILKRVQAVLVGRPKAWEFDKPQTGEEKKQYQIKQRETILQTIRQYNPSIPVIQNLDFGHTDPQIPMPYGKTIAINSGTQTITAEF